MSETAGQRCPNLRACELFPIFALRASLQVWICFYCEGRYEQCARYGLSLASRPVPPNLLPNGRLLNLSPRER